MDKILLHVHVDKYPHVLLTSLQEWDPSVLDYMHPNTCGYPSWAPDPLTRDQHDPRIDECGNFKGRVVETLSILSEDPITYVQKHVQKPTTFDYKNLRPYFGWVNAGTIKKTIENSTQWAVTSTRFDKRKHFKSRFPRRNEAVATDKYSLILQPLTLVSHNGPNLCW